MNKNVKKIAVSVGKTVRKNRVRKGMSQSELAERAGISISTLNRVEAGASCFRILTLYRISIALKVEFAILWK